jgi:3-oxoacyl-[acyl-carrier-protein] synthase-3/clorobiocin biosynthesis protein CloN2
MRVRDVFFSGIGVYLPEILSVESAVALGQCQADDMAARGFTGAGVAGDTPAPEMALHAARDALKNSGASQGDLAALLYTGSWHQGPEGWHPPSYLQHHLTGDDLLATEIRHGCNGTFSAMELAVGVLRAESDRKAVLITASDNFGTPLFKRWDSGVQNTVMCDGATALVMTKSDGFAQLRSICTLGYSELEEADRAGEQMFPPGITEGRIVDFKTRYLEWGKTIVSRDIGMEMLLTHQQRAAECLNRALAEAEVAKDDIKRVIIHTLAKGDASTFLEMIGFPLEQSTWHYGSTIGHCGASDHMLGLYNLLATGQVEPGDYVLLAGMSPGITYKAAVIQIRDIPAWAVRSSAGQSSD